MEVRVWQGERRVVRRQASVNLHRIIIVLGVSCEGRRMLNEGWR
jgi:hypothetical protein